MSLTRSVLRRVLPVPLLLVLIIGGLGGFSPARAVPGEPSLTIQKTLGEDSAPGAALPGVSFQINHVLDVDLSTQEGWGQSAALTVRDILADPDRLGLDLIAETTFDAAGDAVAEFRGLERGLYLVRELPARVGDTHYSVVAPFLVTIPLNTPDGPVHEVRVRAKNQPITLIKTAGEERVRPGRTFTYTLDGSVPAPDINGNLHRYEIVDPLPAEVAYLGRTSLTLHTAGGATRLTEDDDYHVAYAIEDHTVVFEFTPSGLETLADARLGNPDLTVRARFTVRVNDDVRDDAQIRNTGRLYPDGYPRGDDPRTDGSGVPSNTVATIVRVDDGGGGGDGPEDPDRPGGPDGPDVPGDSGDPDASDGTDDGNRPGPGTDVPGSPGGTTGAQPGPGETPDTDDRRRGSLASTGAAVSGILAAGAVLIAVGALLLSRRTRQNQEKQ